MEHLRMNTNKKSFLYALVLIFTQTLEYTFFYFRYSVIPRKLEIEKTLSAKFFIKTR